MTDLPPTSPESLKTRRQALRSQRRKKAWQGIWRFFVLSGMAGALFWVMRLPNWVVREQSQITVEGNHLLSANQIRAFLSLSYGQPIWELPTQKLSEKLNTIAPIAQAKINRQLFPPKLTLTVRERVPVAIATSSQGAGFLDAEGVFIPRHFYAKGAKIPKSLSLKVIGFEPQHRDDWSKLYPLISRSPVKITVIDWRNPNNLILKTALGTVYCGAYSDQFPGKLKALAQLRPLPSRVPMNRLVYIDLSNPDFPAIQLKPLPPKPVKLANPPPVKDR